MAIILKRLRLVDGFIIQLARAGRCGMRAAEPTARAEEFGEACWGIAWLTDEAWMLCGGAALDPGRASHAREVYTDEYRAHAGHGLCFPY